MSDNIKSCKKAGIWEEIVIKILFQDSPLESLRVILGKD
jgi:hypothetical protein